MLPFSLTLPASWDGAKKWGVICHNCHKVGKLSFKRMR